MNPADYTPTQRRNGGLRRAATAKRHPTYKIFLPDVMLDDNLFPTTYQHGKAGGKALVEKRGREWMQEIGRRAVKARRSKIK